MKKSLIVAALLAVAALPMPVLADTANVTIYGVADASFDVTSTGDNRTTGASGGRASKISSNTSLLGFRGEEDLGDGLKAVWQVESEIDLDGTTAANANAATGVGIASRNTFVGLKSESFGSLILGRHDTPYKTSDRRLDLFGNHTADNRSLMGGGIGIGSADASGYDKRARDIAVYNSPMMSGFKLTVGYVAGAEVASNSTNSKGDIWSLSATYDVAPFYGVVAYQRNSYGSVGTGDQALANGAAADSSERAWKIGGGYKVDQFAINAIYERTNDDFGNRGGTAGANSACKTTATVLASGATAPGVATGQSCYGHSAFYLAGQYNFTSNDAFKLAYARTGNLRDGNMPDTGARQTSVGYEHKMSKRTNLYTYYTKMNNDRNVNYGLQGEGAATGNVLSANVPQGASPTSFQLGVMHIF